MRATRTKTKKKSGAKIFVFVLILLIIVAGVLLAMKVFKGKENTETANLDNVIANESETEKEVEKTPKTFAGDVRPIAVMIDNHIDAMPQAGLEQADLVYEMLVEGGETRLMLVLKDKDLSKVGPVRSSRHNFLDYALENDAIYVHYGWSPQAKSDIKSLGVNNINGIFESGSKKGFWRDTGKYAPHNAVTMTENIWNIAKRKGYRTTTSKDPVLNYVVDEVSLDDGQAADTVTIPYSDHNTVKYTYDAEKKVYTRYSRGKKQTDWVTKNTVTTKNIIISFAKNTSIDSYGRQNIDNIRTLDGYYITNGKAIKIKCEKTSRSSQTVYKDLEGNEINVNDGKTFIQICPLNAKVQIAGNTTSTAE